MTSCEATFFLQNCPGVKWMAEATVLRQWCVIGDSPAIGECYHRLHEKFGSGRRAALAGCGIRG
jgi:hypothetical protein